MPTETLDNEITKAVMIYRLIRAMREDIENTSKRIDGMLRILDTIEKFVSEEMSVANVRAAAVLEVLEDE